VKRSCDLSQTLESQAKNQKIRSKDQIKRSDQKIAGFASSYKIGALKYCAIAFPGVLRRND
jgi:hypothetical protein